MAAPSSRSPADRNLLFGILALQMDFISRDQLVAAMNAWVLEKGKALGQILVDQQALRADLHAVLEIMVGKHLEVHGDDPQRSLIALAATVPPEFLGQVGDADVQASLGHLSVTPAGNAGFNATLSFSVGVPTSGGRFRILRPVARGGLGQVHVAFDAELRREVALKEILPDKVGNPQDRARFLAEAEITGGLEHPGIVPVHALGHHDDGRPFYVMRFIRGDSLNEAIRRFHAGAADGATSLRFAGVEFRQLLGRFLDVCNAVAYAHSRGVLHRDLKPGNIMLGKYGETLVVDWGLAKAGGVSDQITDEEALLRPASADCSATLAGSALGTPAFMSPEQAEGRLDLLGPASDIYSLGATLYVLLTGRAPISGKDAGEALAQVRRGEIVPPRQVQPAAPPPLAAICQKAMALKPRDRYASALDLAADIEHWLADEPVSAWPEPMRVRLGRWMRRHPALVSGVAAALFVALLSAGAGALWYQEQQNRQAAAAALRLAHIESALKQAGEHRAGLHAQLAEQGGVFRLLNNPAEWQRQIEAAGSALQRARDLETAAEDSIPEELLQKVRDLEQQLKQDAADLETARKLDKVREAASTLVAGKFNYGHAAEAYLHIFKDAGLQVTFDQEARLPQRMRASPIREQIVASLDDWAGMSLLRGDRKMQARLLAIARELDPDTWRDQVRDPAVWDNAPAMKKLADLDESAFAKLSPQMLGLIGSLLPAQEKENWFKKAIARYPGDFLLLLNYGSMRLEQKPVESAGLLRAALAVRPQSAAAWNNLGVALRAQKDLTGAVVAYNKALEIDPKDDKAWYNLGLALQDQKDLPGAVAAYRKAVEYNPQEDAAWNNLGSVLSQQKDFAGAVLAFKKALDIDKKQAKSWHNLAGALLEQRNLPGAIAAYRQALALNDNDPQAWNNLGNALAQQMEFSQAITAYKKALNLNPKYGLGWHNLALSYLNVGDFAQAALAFQKAAQTFPPDHPYRDFAVMSFGKAKQLLALDRRLPQVLNGEAANPSEMLELIQMCMRYKRHHLSALKLLERLLDDRPKWADDLEKGLRFQAARAALLAAQDKALDAKKLDEQEKAGLREKALRWLLADLDLHRQSLKAGSLKQRYLVVERLAELQQDDDLAGLREPKQLAKLPAERSAWEKLWSDAAVLAKQARGLFTETRHQGTLTAKELEQVFTRKMPAGNLYVIEMRSDQFDTYLRLEDSRKNILDENDDITPENLNSRIIFTPTEDGVYRIVATSFQLRGTGPYTLHIREFTAK